MASEEALRARIPRSLRSRFDARLATGSPLLAERLDRARGGGPGGAVPGAPDELVGLAVALVAWQTVRQIQRDAGIRAADPVSRERQSVEWCLDRLASRKLPYSPEDAAILVWLATASFWREDVRLSLNAARVVLDQAPPPAGHDEVITALRALDRRFDEVDPLRAGKMADWRPKVRNLLMSDDPGTLLVRVFGERDAFGPPALRHAAAHLDHLDVQGLLAHLSSPRGAQPPKAWWPRTHELVTTRSDAPVLLRELIELGTTVPLTATTKDEHGYYAAPVVLFDETNTFIVRGAVWASRFVDRGWVVPQLGLLALRSSAVVDGWWAAEPIAPKIAIAAIDTLGALGTDDAAAELDQLFGEVTLAATVRRVATARGIPESRIKERLAEIRRQARRRPRAHG